jgi:hypothetical protein
MERGQVGNEFKGIWLSFSSEFQFQNNELEVKPKRVVEVIFVRKIDHRADYQSTSMARISPSRRFLQIEQSNHSKEVSVSFEKFEIFFFYILTPVTLKLTQCTSLEVYERFRGTNCFHLHTRRVMHASN